MFMITTECVNCAICVDVCPVDAIVEGDGQYTITSACIDCGKCVEVCPIDAIKGRK
jgi:formate hydrogenlyase subunit 6/NADH:ubiquinone oxidoreductase subunit I